MKEDFHEEVRMEKKEGEQEVCEGNSGHLFLLALRGCGKVRWGGKKGVSNYFSGAPMLNRMKANAASDGARGGGNSNRIPLPNVGGRSLSEGANCKTAMWCTSQALGVKRSGSIGRKKGGNLKVGVPIGGQDRYT